MDSAKLNDWLQVIGLFSVVLSLLFVGMQMRQDLIIADAMLYQMRSDSAAGLSTLMLSSEAARAANRKMFQEGGYDSLTADERSLVNFSFQAVLNHYEGSHYLYLRGLLPQEQWDSDVRQLQSLWPQTEFKRFWTEQRRAGYRESFAREIDKIFD